MKLFWRYLNQRKKYIAAFGLFLLIFAVNFLLYHVPFAAFFYPALLCTVIAALLVGLDFGRVQKKHRQLLQMQKMTAEMLSELPTAETIEETDYQALVEILRKQSIELGTAAALRYQNMIEYYTIWVHQIKTPIASMKLTLQNEDSPLARRLSLDLSRIEQYVEMVLVFLRLDSDSSDYVFREVSLDALIKQSVRKFSGEFIGRKLRLDYEPLNLTIVTDEKWLGFVLEQILSNALKYTREGGVHIYLKEPKLLCIADTGIGIEAEDLPRIFEKGYTGYNGRNDKKASGIGLYLCKCICKNLGIRIFAESKSDSGTTIFLDLEQYELKKE